MKHTEGQFAHEPVGTVTASFIGAATGNRSVATAGARAAELRTKRQGCD